MPVAADKQAIKYLQTCAHCGGSNFYWDTLKNVEYCASCGHKAGTKPLRNQKPDPVDDDRRKKDTKK